MPSMQGFGSRRLMANPCTGDKCANATAAMRARARRRAVMPRGMRGIQYSEALRRNHNGRGLPDHTLEPVIGLAGGETRWRMMTPGRCHHAMTAAASDHFALSAAAFLQSAMNFLRSLPWTPLVSASLEHSSDAAVRGFAAFFSAGAILVVGAGAAGVVCANAELISSRDARA